MNYIGPKEAAFKAKAKSIRAKFFPPVKAITHASATAKTKYIPRQKRPAMPVFRIEARISDEKRQEIISKFKCRDVVLGVVQNTRCAQLRILREVAKRHFVSIADMCGDRRIQEFVDARSEASYRLLTELGLSYPAIGRIIGFRDHSTIKNLVKRFEKRLKVRGDVQ